MQPVARILTCMAPDAITLVLDEMEKVWRSAGPPSALNAASQSTPTPPARAVHVGTFDVVVRHHVKPRWVEFTCSQKAVELQSWLRDVHTSLRDGSRMLGWRFRRAWEVAPKAMLGADLDEVNISVVAFAIEKDIARLESLKDLSDSQILSVARKDELDDLVKKYKDPVRGHDEWAYFAEAVRTGAEFLPLIEMSCGTGDRPLDPVPFVLAVYDAMCPGLARRLVESSSKTDALRETVMLWREMRSRKRPISARRTRMWSGIVSLAGCGGSAERLWKRWPRVRSTVRLDRRELMHGLMTLMELGDIKKSVLVPRDGSVRFDFAPTCEEKLSWVTLLLYAVRNAMRMKFLTATQPISPKARLPLDPTDRFVAEAEALLPPPHRGARGPEPMSNREALPWIFHKLRTGCGWKKLPGGSKLHKRFQAWQQGDLSKLQKLAVEHRVLTDEEARQLTLFSRRIHSSRKR